MLCAPVLTGTPVSLFFVRTSGSTNFTILSGPVSPCYMRPCLGNTNFTVLYGRLLARALISLFYQEHQFRYAICGRANGSTNFTFNNCPCKWEH